MSRSVLIVGPSLSAGGAERVLAELANAWVRSGWAVAVVTLADASVDHYVLHEDVRRVSLGLSGSSRGFWAGIANNIRRILQIRNVIRSIQPDIVISFVDQVNMIVLLASVWTDWPVIVSERVDPRMYDIGPLWTVARRLLYPMASAVVVQTEAVAGWARKRAKAWRVVAIPNPVWLLREPNRQDADRLVLAVGRLENQKGFDLLVRAFSQSRARQLGYRLAILGCGSERESIVSLARSLELEDKLDMPGIVPNPEEWMERAPIFALPSRFEGFPNALLEAMAMGCAVVATDCNSGPRELITHGHDGLLIPTEDAAALASALDRLVDDPALRVRLASRAKEVRRRFSMQVVLARWIGLANESIGRKAADA